MNSQHEWLQGQLNHNLKEQASIRKHLEGLARRLRQLEDEAQVLNRDLQRTQEKSLKKDELEVKKFRATLKDMSF